VQFLAGYSVHCN